MPRSSAGRIFQRGKVWWVQYGHRGEDIRESSGSQKRADAVALLRKRMGEMGTGRLVGPQAERVTFEALAQGIRDDYAIQRRKSVHAMEAALKHLGAAFGMMRALDITTDRIRRYVAARQEEGAAPATIRTELAILRRCFNLALQAELLTTKPHVPTIRVDNARQGFFDVEDFERVVEDLPEEVRPIARFAFLTGWRKGEILPLRWSQVDFSAGVVRLEPGTTKNDEGREFPFRVLRPLEELLETQRDRTRAMEKQTGEIIPWVFHRGGRPIRSFRGAWDAACERAGVPAAIFHDLRRTAVRNLERAGVPRSVAMKLTGHKTEAVYRRYAIADHAALSEGVEKLARLHGAPVPASKIVPLAGRGA